MLNDLRPGLAMRTPISCASLLPATLTVLPLGGAARAQHKPGPHDWPMYNRDVLGTRHNPAEKTLGPENVDKLVEKWRFPPADSKEKVGVVHAVVAVNGYVYFGTETFPAFYKLTPDGKVRWVYRHKDAAK